MKDSEKRTNKTSMAAVGFVLGVLTVVLVLLALNKC